MFAILMATLAPTISQTLAARDAARGGDAMSGEHCDIPSMSSMDGMEPMSPMSGMHDMAPESPIQAEPASLAASDQHDDPHGLHTQSTSTSNGDACGYCSLLAHLPAIPSVEALFFVTVRAIQQRVAVRFERVLRAEPLPFAQPRAPPFTS